MIAMMIQTTNVQIHPFMKVLRAIVPSGYISIPTISPIKPNIPSNTPIPVLLSL